MAIFRPDKKRKQKKIIACVAISTFIFLAFIIFVGGPNFADGYAFFSFKTYTDKPVNDFIYKSFKAHKNLKLSDIFLNVNLDGKLFIISNEDSLRSAQSVSQGCFLNQDERKSMADRIHSNFGWSLFGPEYMFTLALYDHRGFYKDYTMWDGTFFCNNQPESCLPAKNVHFEVVQEEYPRNNIWLCYRIIEKETI